MNGAMGKESQYLMLFPDWRASKGGGAKPVRGPVGPGVSDIYSSIINPGSN